MSPKASLEMVFYSLKSPFWRGFSSTYLASNVTIVAGMSGWNGSNQVGPDNLSKEQELGVLKEQATDLRKQMKEIEARIKKLEKAD